MTNEVRSGGREPDMQRDREVNREETKKDRGG